jgi:hypothetical protein
MNQAIDAGMVLWEHEEPVGPEDSVFGLYQRLFMAAAGGFWPAVGTLLNGGGRDVDLALGAYYTFPTEQEIAEFRATGHRYV